MELDTFSVSGFDENNFVLCGGRKGELVKIDMRKNFSCDIKKENIGNSHIHFILKIDEKYFATAGKDGILKLFEY